jgi:hypothetical protein
MQAPDAASGAPRAEQDAQAPGAPAERRGLLAGVDGGAAFRWDRRREIDARLDAVRARIRELEERDPDAGKGRTA